MVATSSRPRRTSPLNLSGAFELFGKSYRIIKVNFSVFMVVFAINGLMALWDTLGRFVDNTKNGKGWTDSFSSGLLGPDANAAAYLRSGGFLLVVLVLSLISYLLLTILTVRSAQGHKPSLTQLWNELTRGWLWARLIGATLLMGVVLLAGILLLIIPGIILLWRLFLVPYVVIDQDTKITEAFKRSWRMTSGFGWPIYSIILVELLFNLTSTIPVLGSLISFVLLSIYSVAPALRYQEIKRLQGSDAR